VVVHELAHLEKKNNSRIFWDKVKSLIPDYKKYQGWLKRRGKEGLEFK
jgi:predicted metal-dependent hydrolase